MILTSGKSNNQQANVTKFLASSFWEKQDDNHYTSKFVFCGFGFFECFHFSERGKGLVVFCEWVEWKYTRFTSLKIYYILLHRRRRRRRPKQKNSFQFNLHVILRWWLIGSQRKTWREVDEWRKKRQRRTNDAKPQINFIFMGIA